MSLALLLVIVVGFCVGFVIWSVIDQLRKQHRWRKHGMQIGDEVMCAIPGETRWVIGRIMDFTATHALIAVEYECQHGRESTLKVYRRREEVLPTKETLDKLLA